MEEMNVEAINEKLPSLKDATPKELAFAIAEVLGVDPKELYSPQ